MKITLSVVLTATPDQASRLQVLQQVFAQACNALAPVVQQTRCWNRVTLHHLKYRSLREQFPALGSQMVCNAIYSVSRAARLVFQHPDSPFLVGRRGGEPGLQPVAPLPMLNFLPSAPVFFDRHTLTIRSNALSLYTLDGRIHFQLALPQQQLALFAQHRLREVMLTARADGQYVLGFTLVTSEDGDDAPASTLPEVTGEGGQPWPSYLIVKEVA